MTSYQTLDAAPPPPPARLGRYELLGKLATGGMGEIHLARLVGDGGFERLCVVKRLLPELVASAQFVAMFLDEARIAARLSHPNVCEVHELGRDGNDYYLAMPYLEGVAFGDLIGAPREADRARALRQVAGLGIQACEGLHHAHELRGADGEPLGLVHRDVSPSNLFVTTTGVVKVLDFGIAKVRGATARTELGTIKGKHAYMSPEQVRGDELDRRSDVFSLGVVLFELATHQRLFKRPSDFLAAKAILEEPIARADEVDPAIPRALADVIARALARERGDRYATARELGTALGAAVGGAMSGAELAETIAADRAAEITAQKTRQREVVEAATVALGPRRRRPRSRAVPAALATLVALAGIAVAVLATRRCGEARDGGAGLAATAAVDGGMVAAAVADAAPVPDAVAVAVAVAEADAGAKATKPPDRRDGFLSVDSKPYATIFIDGKRLGVTPLLRKPLPPGKHKLRAVTEAGAERTLTITIRPGRVAPPVNLTW